MTNQISKAREALRELFKMTDDPKACYHHYNTVKDLLTTLSTVDAGRLGESLEMMGLVKANLRTHVEFEQATALMLGVAIVEQAARTLHGIIGEKI